MNELMDDSPFYLRREPNVTVNESVADLLLHLGPESDATVNEPVDWLMYYRPESDATVVEVAGDGHHVSGDAAEPRRVNVAQAGSEGSTIEPSALDGLREELKKIQLTIKDSAAAASALKSEMDSLSALAIEIEAEYGRVQEAARAALERGATVEQRLEAIELRLGPLGDLEDVRREIETRFDALTMLAQEVRATTEAVNRQQLRIEQLAVETTARLQQREQRDEEFGHERARSQSVQAVTESAGRPAWEQVDRLEGGATRTPRSLSSLSLPGTGNAVWRLEGKLPAAIGNLRLRLLSLHVAEAMANLRVPKTIVLVKYVAIAAVFTALALMSAFVLRSVGRTADPVGMPAITPTTPVPSTAVPNLPGATSATTSSASSLDSAPTVQSLTRTRQAASVGFETPATRRATTLVGTLSIRSTPDKAEVHIDRERVGETPLSQRLRAGSHVIRIEHEGYQRWTAGVNVPADKLTQVTVKLQTEPRR